MRSVLLTPVVVLVSLVAGLLPAGPANAVTEPAAATDFPIIWSGTVDVTASSYDMGDFRTEGTYNFFNLEPTGQNFGYYAGRTATGSKVEYDRWCALHGDRRDVTFAWDNTGESGGSQDFPALELFPGDQAGELALSINNFATTATRTHNCTADSLPATDTEEMILANPLVWFYSYGTGILPDAAPEVLRVVGSTTVSEAGPDEGYQLDISYDLTGRYDYTCGSNIDDSDGDRLLNSYETQVTFSDPEKCDTDNDGFRDAIEVASGSSPTSSEETPNTLSAGASSSSVTGTGDVGVTCGRSRFKWVSPTLRPLGVPKGAKSCIFLLSNETAKGLVATAFGTDKGTITSAITDYMRPHLGEINGEQAVNWRSEAEQYADVWAPRVYVKRALARGMNFTRLNASFAVGQLTGLAGVALGALWKLNQIENRDACIQVRIGTSAAEGANLSWSLVYSREQLTREGVEDGLHRAGVWQKKVRLGPDTAVRRHVNLSCSGGQVVAGGGAGAVFDRARSLVN